MKEMNILIVEDEKKIADTLQKGLRENGYHAQVAYDGGAAFDLFSRQAFGLLLMDINLPGMNGFDLCKKVREKDNTVPVIMLTCLGAMQDKVNGYEAGADDYIVKPFEFSELLLKIRAMLKRQANQLSTEIHLLKADNLEMNLFGKEVWRDGEKISLTAKEFRLLEYLLRNKNKVLSRADIAMHVWGISFDTNTNMIDVYINYLRNKIDRKYMPRLIHTQVGIGYVLKSKE